MVVVKGGVGEKEGLKGRTRSEWSERIMSEGPDLVELLALCRDNQ